MGGYGALKIAFSRPHSYRAVAAVAPMLEPSLRAEATPLRTRFHYPPEVPAALLGAERDAALYQRDHPGTRARENAEALRAQRIWIDANSRDALNAHDGAEHLHRLLWELDLPHDYHLHRDADHVGPSLVPRLRAAFHFVGAALHASPAADRAGAEVDAPDARALRQALQPARERAAERGPTLSRTYAPTRDWRL